MNTDIDYLKPEKIEDEDESETMLIKAMNNAKKAFMKTFEDSDIEGAYFQLDMIGYTLTTSFTPMSKISMTDYASGTRQDPDWIKEDGTN